MGFSTSVTMVASSSLKTFLKHVDVALAHGLVVGLEELHEGLDLVILGVFSNLNNPKIPKMSKPVWKSLFARRQKS